MGGVWKKQNQFNLVGDDMKNPQRVVPSSFFNNEGRKKEKNEKFEFVLFFYVCVCVCVFVYPKKVVRLGRAGFSNSTVSRYSSSRAFLYTQQSGVSDWLDHFPQAKMRCSVLGFFFFFFFFFIFLFFYRCCCFYFPTYFFFYFFFLYIFFKNKKRGGIFVAS